MASHFMTMKLSDNKEKQRSLELAEESRETEWKFTSFVAELFNGDFRWDLISPFPAQDPEDKKIGDAFLVKLEDCLRKHLDPDEVDRTGEIPEPAMKAMAELGCFGMKIPKEYEGLGLSQINYNRAIAFVGSYCASTAVLLSAHQSIGVPQPLKMFGTKEQKEKYLPRFAKGEVSAFALTEVDVGSDPAQMQTIATEIEGGDFYEINGTKLWCTNGPIASTLIVMAKTAPKIVNGKERPQITAFIVETNTPGFEVLHRCQFMGLHGINNGLIKFTNVKVPKENIIGALGKGLKIALVTLNTGRLTIPAASSAMNKLCLNGCRQWGKSRSQWGLPVGKHQAVSKKLADMAADTFATESVTLLASSFADRENADIRLEAAIAKFFCTEVSWKVVDEAVQIRGGRGFESAQSLKERGEIPMPFERMMRDSRINRIIEGTSEIMRLFIAREAMDKHFRLLMPLMDPRTPFSDKINMGLKVFINYSVWYPKQWSPFSTGAKTKYLSNNNKQHLNYISKTTKKLARNLFHAMAKFQQRLEKEQLILFRFVDIGTDLFAMSASLSRAEQLLSENPKDSSPQLLADLFCINAKKRIQEGFNDLKMNNGKKIGKIADMILNGDYGWLEDGILNTTEEKKS